MPPSSTEGHSPYTRLGFGVAFAVSDVNPTSKYMTTMGIIDKLHKGMTREAVVSVLGTPDDVSCLSGRDRPPGIYKYGEIELYFEPGTAGRLYMVYTEVETEEGRREGLVLLE